MKRFICLILLISFISTSAFGQATGGSTKGKTGPRRQLAAIVFAGLSGAVLGLSTLSFYGRPQEYLVNIAIGFAVGVIAGTIYVTYKTATTRDYYEEMGPQGPGANYLGLTETDLVAENEVKIEEPKMVFSPALYKDKPETQPSFGAQLIYNF